MDSKDPRGVSTVSSFTSNQRRPAPIGASSSSVNSNVCQDRRSDSVWDTSSREFDFVHPQPPTDADQWEGPHAVVIPRGPLGFGFTLRHFVVYPPQPVLDDSSDGAEGLEDDGDYCSQGRDSLYQHQRPRLQRQLSIKPHDTIFVRTVKENSPADLSGLHPGDRLVAINGDSVTGKPYQQIIETIHNCDSILKLLVVPKDEDILQMAYPIQSEESFIPNNSSLSDIRGRSGGEHLYPVHSQSSLSTDEGKPAQKNRGRTGSDVFFQQHDVRHSFPLSGLESQVIDYRLGPSSEYQPLRSGMYHQQVQTGPNFGSNKEAQMSAQESNFAMTCNIPSKSKYSVGLYFPPKTSSGNSNSSHTEMSKSAASVTRRKSSLDESSVLSASAKSRDYFIRYSTDKAASDNRNRYSPRHSAYERYTTESPPETFICRSKTISNISPTKSLTQPLLQTTAQVSAPTRHYVPVLSESKMPSSSDSIDHRTGSQFVVRIPYDQQQQQSALAGTEPQTVTLPLVRQNYGTTFALTRSPTATHIEIQKSIGKPIVSQRKYQFEVAAASEQTPAPPTVPSGGAHNRYKTEIEKIRTQPKFSSIAMRKASFEQSPDRDPPGFDDPEQNESGSQNFQLSKVETAQPTIKVRKISSERYTSGTSLPTSDMQDRDRSGSNIRIFVSPGNPPHTSSSSVVEIGIDSYKKPTLRTQASGQHQSQLYTNDSTLLQASSSTGPSSSPTLSKESIYRGPSSSAGSRGSLGGDSSAGLADSGVWVKSYHSSSSTDMLDGIGSGSIDSSSCSSNVPPIPSVVTGDDNGDNMSRLSTGRPPRKTSYLSAVNAPAPKTSLPIQQPGPIESRSNLMQTPQQQVAQSRAQAQALPQSFSLLSAETVSPSNPPNPSEESTLASSVSHSDSPIISKEICSSSSLSLQFPSSPMPSTGSSQSLNSMVSGTGADSGSSAPSTEAPEVTASSAICRIQAQSMEGHHHGEMLGFSSGDGDAGVTMRKKVQESLEDQANKLHRRTSYLMATARDRTNTVPIEQAFSSPQAPQDVGHIQTSGSARHQSSAKLNKFFGEMIPSIAEGVEIIKSSEGEETPEIIRKGPLSCKISVIEGKKCSDRSWKAVFATLRQNELFLTREKDSPASSGFEDQHIPLCSIMVEFARDYAKKKKHVFRMSTHNECEYLFQTEDRGTMLCWIQAIKSINEPDKAGKMDEMIASEQDRHFQATPIEINIIPSHKMSPQIGGHKGRKLSALSLKAKLSSSPSMRRKKSSVIEKDESIKKTWMGRISMMKSSKKHSEDSNSISLSEQDGDLDKMQFGVRLEDCFPSPHNQYVPLIVELCTRIVEARGLEVIGVYRVPGNSAAINALTEEFNRGIDAVNIDNEKLLDINVISSLLKSFFRKLDDPLVPSEYYENFIEANRHPDESKRKLKIKRLLHLLPPHHHETFRHMAEHLNKVASYGNINKMDAKNLAIMFGPTLVRKKEDDTVSLVTDMSDQCRIVESIILHHDWFFSTWDQDNYIPMETTVETVNLDDGQNTLKDEDEEADSAISTKELISSIVGAASKKLRSQRQAASLDIVESVDGSSTVESSPVNFSERNIDEEVYLASLTKTGKSSPSRSASEEFLNKKGTFSGTRSDVVGGSSIVVPVAPIMAASLNTNKKTKGRCGSSSSDPYFGELQYADATPPSPSLSSSTATGVTNISRYFSDESLLADVIDSNDELDDEMEILHPGGRLPTSLSRDAIHDTLKRIGNDVSALLHTFEQKQQKERERRRREQERVEAEHRRTRLELEQEDFEEGFNSWLLPPSWKKSTSGSKEGKIGNEQPSCGTSFSLPTNKMPDVVSSSYLGEHYPYDQERALFMRGKGELMTSPKVISNVSLPPQQPSTTVFSPQQGALVSLPSSHMEPKLKLSQRESPDFLLTDLHIQESPKEEIRSLPQNHLPHDSQARFRQQLTSGADKDLQKPLASLRHSFGRRHGSLDSLIDMIDKDKRASWASSDSEDGSDLLTSITTTFDQKLQILLNPKYKLTGAGRKAHKSDNITSENTNKGIESPRKADISKTTLPNTKQTSYTMAALLDSDRSFQDPSLHRSAKSDPKIGIASRFERNDNVRAASSSPKSCSPLDNVAYTSQLRKRDLPDFRSFFGKIASSSSQQRDLASVILTQPKKLDFGNNGSGRNRVVRRNSGRTGKPDVMRSKSEKLEMNSERRVESAVVSSDLKSSDRGDKENLETPEQVRNRKNQHRRHTVGGVEDFEHISALTHINDNSNAGKYHGDNSSVSSQHENPSAWEQLRPALKETGPGSMQAWIQRERLRGSTPDLSCKQEKNG
ncbi:hypothetical protein RRG08_012534 [Elysia crispata]|uniref:Rho GTPase-activating protein 21 n=1 Tax=Elysia crispata TaxID=231223 RepID=A0AAE1AQ95_9GAST|nr:hypothetical protein RRG08_012534 [Elysia crispata]